MIPCSTAHCTASAYQASAATSVNVLITGNPSVSAFSKVMTPLSFLLRPGQFSVRWDSDFLAVDRDCTDLITFVRCDGHSTVVCSCRCTACTGNLNVRLAVCRTSAASAAGRRVGLIRSIWVVGIVRSSGISGIFRIVRRLDRLLRQQRDRAPRKNPLLFPEARLQSALPKDQRQSRGAYMFRFAQCYSPGQFPPLRHSLGIPSNRRFRWTRSERAQRQCTAWCTGLGFGCCRAGKRVTNLQDAFSRHTADHFCHNSLRWSEQAAPDSSLAAEQWCRRFVPQRAVRPSRRMSGYTALRR